MKKLLSIALLSTLGFSYTLVMPYGAYIDYSKESLKDKGYDGGVYLSYFKWPFKIELAGEYLDIQYKSIANTNDYIEKDVTFVGNHYIGSNYQIRFGVRSMFINQGGNSDSYDEILFGGVLYYEYLKYNFGLDYYHSMYDGFHVNQFTPHFGFNFGNYYSDTGSFYLDMKVNIIKISNSNIANTGDDNYVDSDFSLTNYKGPWATTIKASIGRNAYKVTNGGFSVYNLGEEYKYSFGLDISYKLNKNSSLKVGFNRSKFKENGLNAYSNVYVASYSISF